MTKQFLKDIYKYQKKLRSPTITVIKDLICYMNFHLIFQDEEISQEEAYKFIEEDIEKKWSVEFPNKKIRIVKKELTKAIAIENKRSNKNETL